MTQWLLLALSAVLIVVCGVFVAGEFALLAVERSAVRRAVESGDGSAGGVLAALRTLSTQLSGVQIAITVTNLAVGFLAEPALAVLLHAPLRAIGVRGAAVGVVALTVALTASTLLTMLFGELVPKNLAIAAPLAVAEVVQAPVRAFTAVLRHPIRLLNRLSNLVLHMFGVAPQEELATARSPGELAALVQHSAREGVLPTRTASRVMRSLAFGDRRAGDVMTPRPRMLTVAAEATVGDSLDRVRTWGRSRLPVTGAGGVDEIVGVIDLDQAVAVAAERRATTTVREIMAAVVEVPESLPLAGVLRVLREGRAQLAIVIDEYGGTAGLLTGEDILEELVGEVDDEYDAPAATVRDVGDGWEVAGLLRPDEISAATGYALPGHGPYDTLGGLLMHALGRLPVSGDRVVIGGVAATVTRMDGHRVDRVHLSWAAGSGRGEGEVR